MRPNSSTHKRLRVCAILSACCGLAPTIALTACGPSSTPIPAPVPSTMVSPAATDAIFDVGGVSLHIHCVGEGEPAVILEAGLGDDGGIWRAVQPGLARFTQACAYDRAGTGSSSAAPTPHFSRDMMRELHTALGLAHVTPPYVLVGHSLGGLNVRLFAANYEDETAGMVLIDATTEEQDSRFWSLLPEDTLRQFRDSLAKHPEGLDYDAFRASMADLRSSKRSLGDMPLVVLTHGREEPPPPGVPPAVGAQLERAWQAMQSSLTSLSSDGVQIIAQESGHYIHREAPQLVLAATSEVVRAVRQHTRVDRNAIPIGPEKDSP